MANKSSYSFHARSARTTMYKNQSIEEKFVQQKEQKIHESMDPKKALLREARDSDTFPNSLPVIFGLDMTGSMEEIPNHIINEGLPKLISLLHERGLTDAAVMFMGLGDSKCRDRAPLQVSQFESSDEPMDFWLTHVWIEKGGGGNRGESYSWAWWFAANRVVTDAWEKRKEKGFIFTVGDDNCHGIASGEFDTVLGINHESMSAEDLYKAASEKWNVYHINLKDRQVSGDSFRAYMGENLLEVRKADEIPALMAQIISSHAKTTFKSPVAATPAESGAVAPKVTL